MRPVTIACVLYQGEDVPAHSLGIFTPEWVDRLYRGIKRNTSREFRFVCFVDRDYEFTEPVESKKLTLPYRNMFSLLEPFREDMGRVVFMGLDTIITGNIDALLDYDGPFAMLTDPYYPERPCSGVMCFPYMPEIWADVEANHAKHAQDATMFGFPSDMIYLAKHKSERIDHYVDGIYSYKAHIKPNPELLEKARIVYFHGKEKPHELAGLEWVERHWGAPLMGKPEFITGLNTPMPVMIAQAEENLRRDLPLFREQPANKHEALIVGGGPSLKESLPHLRRHHDRGGIIFSVNGAHDWLLERGIIPDYQVVLDARPENIRFVLHPHKNTTYLIAAQCHPSLFDVLDGFRVVQWVACTGSPASDADLGKKFSHKPVMMVGGGATVGLKTMNLAYLAGFRKFHFYGFDSSYRDGENHAYRQDLNDKESRMEIVAAGKRFTCAPWMAKQAMEFQSQMRQLLDRGCQFNVHGDGLIPWICKQWETHELRP